MLFLAKGGTARPTKIRRGDEAEKTDDDGLNCSKNLRREAKRGGEIRKRPKPVVTAKGAASVVICQTLSADLP